MNTPWVVAVTGIGQLENGTSLSVFDTAPGGVQDRILRASASVLQCASDLFQLAEERDVLLSRNDALCPSYLRDAALVASINVSAATDPCCDATARQWQCCAARPYSYVVRTLVNAVKVAASPSDAGLQCRDTQLASTLWNRYASFGRDFVSSVCDVHFRVDTGEVRSSLARMRQCYERVYRGDVTCHAHTDCLSGLCWDNRCVPEPGLAPLELLQCTLVELGVDARPLLLLQLQLRVSSLNADLERAFTRRVVRAKCVQLRDPLDPFEDVRFAPEVVDATTESTCENAVDVVCEDGLGPADCTQRSVCVYEWTAPLGQPSPRPFVANDTKVCTTGGLCSNPGVTGARCALDQGCSEPACGPADVCTTATRCAASGHCSGWSLARKGGDCVMPFSSSAAATAYEQDQCEDGFFWAPSGCVAFAPVASPAACSLLGGSWVTTFNVTRDACLATRRCSRNSALAVAPVNVWKPGVWGTGTVVRFAQRAARLKSARRWLWLVDWASFEALLSPVLVQQMAAVYGSYRRCQLLPMLTVARFGLCDCSQLAGRPPADECWDATRPLVLGVRRILKGTSGTALIAQGTLSWFVSSCDDDAAACVLEFGLLLRVPPNQLSAGTSSSSNSGSGGVSPSTGGLTGSGARDFVLPVNRFEQVLNDKGMGVLGASVSDLMYLGFSERLRNGVEVRGLGCGAWQRSLLFFFPQLCIEPDREAFAATLAACMESLSANSKFQCVAQFAFSASSATPLSHEMIIVTPRLGQYCATVRRAGYYAISMLRVMASAATASLLLVCGLLFVAALL